MWRSGTYRLSGDPSPLRLWLLVFFCALVLYLVTAQRAISWQDSGMYQWRILAADYSGALGLALAHPLYIVLAQILKLLPPEHLAWYINAGSGLGMAVALANFACLTHGLTHRLWVALGVTGMLMTCHAVWWLSTLAEVYTWVVAGFTAELLLLTRLYRSPDSRVTVLLALVSGLGLSLHNLALLPVPVYVCSHLYLVMRGSLRPSSLVFAALAFVAGSSLFLGMIVELALRSGSPGMAITSALFGDFGGAALNADPAAGYWKINAALTGLSFLNILLPLAVIGWIHLPSVVGKPAAAALYAITGIEFLFWVRYPVPDQFTFVLPTLIAIAVASAIGLHVLVERRSVWRTWAIAGTVVSIIGMPLVYGVLPGLLAEDGRFEGRARLLPFRNESAYWIQPWKHTEFSAKRFAQAALREARPNGIILADETSVYPLMLERQREANAEGILIQFHGMPLPPYNRDPEGFRSATKGRPVFAVSPVPGYMPAGMGNLLKDAAFAPTETGVLYRMRE